MNERIKELYAQAIQYADSVVPANNRYNDIYYAIASGKHAELIVRECIAVGMAKSKELFSYSKKEGDIFEYESHGAEDAVDSIKEHFGVDS